MRFSAGVKRWSKKARGEVENLRKQVIIELFSSVILDTPVLTGRLRGNWQISSGVPGSGTVEVTDPSGASTIRKVEGLVSRLPEGKDQSIYLTNNLPYAYRIEYDGWSHIKAPEGMVRKNFIRISDNLKSRFG